MDAVKFLKEALRMCESYTNCTDCVLEQKGAVVPCNCFITSIETEALDKLVAIIEKWTKEHPIKTRQSEMLKMFPMTRLNEEGIIDIDPCDVNTSLGQDSQCQNLDCRICKKMFWKEEIR